MKRGLPIFTSGLRLLIDGIRMFPPGSWDGANTKRLTRYATAVHWDEPFCTFNGNHPGEPSTASTRSSGYTELDDETHFFVPFGDG